MIKPNAGHLLITLRCLSILKPLKHNLIDGRQSHHLNGVFLLHSLLFKVVCLYFASEKFYAPKIIT